MDSPAPARALVFPARKTDLKSRVQTQKGAGETPLPFQIGKVLGKRRQEREVSRRVPPAPALPPPAASALPGWDLAETRQEEPCPTLLPEINS